MIDLEFLESLIRAIDQSGLDSIEIERGGTRVRLSKTPPFAQAPIPIAPAFQGAPAAVAGTNAGGGSTAAPAGERPAPAAAGAHSRDLVEVKSPMVGTFYRAPAPDAPPYVDVGSRVKKGDTLCIIEAMKLMNELECEVTGTIAEVCVDNAQPVEFGQVLFRVDPS